MSIFLFPLAFAQTVAQSLPTVEIMVGEKQLLVEVADEAHERRVGLMYRTSLPENNGMIFLYNKEEIRSFWMKNTYIPLSIAYADKDGKIVHIADMVPKSTTPVPSVYPAQYVLEVNKGWFDKNGVEVGMLLQIPSTISTK